MLCHGVAREHGSVDQISMDERARLTQDSYEWRIRSPWMMH